MSFSNQDPAGIGLKKFVTEDELEEKRKKRQEEWEKVRKPEDPAECPEEVYDPRSLFEQLEAQKQKKQDDYDQLVRERNQVKGLEEDEAKFLSYVSDRQLEIDRQRKVEAASVLQEMRDYNIVSTAKVTGVSEEKKPVKPQVGSSQGKSQMALLAGAIKRKSTENSDGEKRRKLSGGDSLTQPVDSVKEADNGESESRIPKNSVAQIIGVLPGLGEYTNDTSDSETSSSESDIEIKPTCGQDRVIIGHAMR